MRPDQAGPGRPRWRLDEGKRGRCAFSQCLTVVEDKNVRNRATENTTTEETLLSGQVHADVRHVPLALALRCT